METAGTSSSAVWLEKHKEWIAKVPNGKHVVVEKSGHFIQAEQPQVVIEAIRQVVNQVQRKTP
jgi:pimeloyl-ACP methyl ester carboxylesterase